MDLRILTLVLDLVAALVHVLVDALVVEVLGQLPLVAAPADREVAGRLRSGVEVLVPPAARRNEERPGLPVDLGPGVTARRRVARPHVRVALAGEEDDVVAGTVTVALFVRADRELAH